MKRPPPHTHTHTIPIISVGNLWVLSAPATFYPPPTRPPTRYYVVYTHLEQARPPTRYYVLYTHLEQALPRRDA